MNIGSKFSRSIIFLAMAVALLHPAVPIQAQTVTTNTLHPVADSYVRDGSSSNSNFGTITSLYARTNFTIINNGYVMASYLKFNLSSVTNLSSAKLRIYAKLNASQGPITVAASSTTDTNWTETGITWSNHPALGKQLGSVEVINNTEQWYEYDVTSFIQGEKAAGRSFVSLALYATSVSSSNTANWAIVRSREAASNVPELVCRFDPSVAGQWGSVMNWSADADDDSGRNVAVHLVLLPTGNLILWPYVRPPRLWDPGTSNFTSLSQPRAPGAGGGEYDINIFCGAHSHIPDGRVLFTGGQMSDFTLGETNASYFDPFKTNWITLPHMNDGRWYGTSTALPNGDVLVTSGFTALGRPLDHAGGAINSLPQVWMAAGNGMWRDLNSTSATSVVPPPYTRAFLAPNGKVFFAMGATNADPEYNISSRFLDTSGTGAWSDHDANLVPKLRGHNNLNNPLAAACMDESGTVYWFGGEEEALDPAMPTHWCEKINLTSANPAWTTNGFAPMNVGGVPQPRKYHTATILPTGKILITSGSDTDLPANIQMGIYATNTGGRHALLYDPVSNTWATLAKENKFRGYHSTAVLLPDGRVLSAGGHGEWLTYTDPPSANAEIFSPPYLFSNGTNATRPVISSAPNEVTYGETFFVGTPDSASITNVTWTRLGNTTHGFNWDQRINTLKFSSNSGGGLSVTAPAKQTICPPGYYMLWLINSNGVPSVSKMVRISTDRHDLNAEFALPSNPSSDTNHWSYGYLTNLASVFQPVTVQYNGSYADDGTPIPSWQLTTSKTPAFYWNPTNHAVTLGSGVLTMDSHGVLFFPGETADNASFGAIRYKVQYGEAGLYQIRALVEAAYLTLGIGDTDFHVLTNGVEVFSQNVYVGASAAYVRSLVLNSGDTVDFVVGRGLDNSAYASGLKIWANLQRVGSAAPLASHDVREEFSVATNPSTRWAYGYSTYVGGSFVPVGVKGTNSSDSGSLIFSWQYLAAQEPTFYYNSINVPITVGGGQLPLPAKGVWFYPGNVGQAQNFGIIRYTVPTGEGGLYQIGAIVEAVYLSWNTGDSDFHILKNGVELRNQGIAPGGHAVLDAPLKLSPGDTVDFAIGRGADGDSYASGLKIWAEVCRIQ